MADKSVKSRVRPGSKLEKLYNLLKQRGGGELEFPFTSALAQELTTELGVRLPESVWNMLQRLDKKGLIKRKRRVGEKGIIVTLNDDSNPTVEVTTEVSSARNSTRKRRRKSRVRKTPLTIDELLKKLRGEVRELTARKGKLVKQIKQMKIMIHQLGAVSRK